MRGLRALALALLVSLVAVPLPASGQEGDVLPFPRTGEVFHYTGKSIVDGEERAIETVVAVAYPFPTQDRTGAPRKAIFFEVAERAGSGASNPSEVLSDPGAVRMRFLYDGGRLELLEVQRTASLRASENQGVGPLEVLGSTSVSEVLTRSFADAGVPHVLAGLWGRTLPEGSFSAKVAAGPDVTAVTAVGSNDPDSLGSGYVELTRSPDRAGVLDVVFEPLGSDVVGGVEARGWAASYPRGERTVTRELWLNPQVALPVREVVAEEAQDGSRTVRDLVLKARGRASELSFSWGVPWGQGVVVPEVGPLSAEGPADGTGAMPYPLSQAVRHVLGNPSLVGLQRMALTGEPVLVKAVYEVGGPPDPGRLVPDARWWLVFHDVSGAEVVVETRSAAGPQAAVDREFPRVAPVSDLGPVRPQDLPEAASTIGGAIAAWTAFQPEVLEPSLVVYDLERLQDGTLAPMVWAGYSSSSLVVQVPGAVTNISYLSLLGVDADGFPRLGLSTAWGDAQGLPGYTDNALQSSEVGEASAAGLREQPLLLAASLGVGVAVLGLGAKLLAPLYARLTGRQITDHPHRRALLELARKEPGIHFDAARQRLGLGAGTAFHHVHKLEREGLLQTQRAGRYLRLYPADAPRLLVSKDAALRQPRAAALYRLVKEQPGIGLREAARALGLPASSLQWHAAQLEKAGLIEKRGQGLRSAG